jgi:hypothetical protein
MILSLKCPLFYVTLETIGYAVTRFYMSEIGIQNRAEYTNLVREKIFLVEAIWHASPAPDRQVLRLFMALPRFS